MRPAACGTQHCWRRFERPVSRKRFKISSWGRQLVNLIIWIAPCNHHAIISGSKFRCTRPPRERSYNTQNKRAKYRNGCRRRLAASRLGSHLSATPIPRRCDKHLRTCPAPARSCNSHPAKKILLATVWVVKSSLPQKAERAVFSVLGGHQYWRHSV